MKRIKLFDTEISELCFGCDRVGTYLSKELSYELLDRFIEAGGNFLDTARLYCKGNSEGFIREYLNSRNLKNIINVATKAGHPPVENMKHSRINREDIEFDINTSLKELGTDCIYMLYLHRDDETQPAGEILELMNEFIKCGKIHHFAVSNWKGSRIKEANEYAKAHGLSPIVASSILYNIAKHNGHPDSTLVVMDEKELEFYTESKLPVFAFSSQAKGFFEKVTAGAELPDGTKKQYLNDENIKLANEFKMKSAETGKTISKLSLEKLIGNSDFPVFPIIGVSSMEQLNQIL